MPKPLKKRNKEPAHCDHATNPPSSFSDRVPAVLVSSLGFQDREEKQALWPLMQWIGLASTCLAAGGLSQKRKPWSRK